MGLTKAARHNRMMDRVFSEADRLKKDPTVKSYKRHQFKEGKAIKDRGDQYPGPKSKALKKKTDKDDYSEYRAGGGKSMSRKQFYSHTAEIWGKK